MDTRYSKCIGIYLEILHSLETTYLNVNKLSLYAFKAKLQMPAEWVKATRACHFHSALQIQSKYYDDYKGMIDTT